MKRFVLAAFLAFHLAAVSAHDDPYEPKRIYVDGEVVKVDAKKKTITLKHAAVSNLPKEAGTTEFPVRDESMLKQVKRGDKVVFSARNINGTVTLRTLELASGAKAAPRHVDDHHHSHTGEGHKH